MKIKGKQIIDGVIELQSKICYSGKYLRQIQENLSSNIQVELDSSLPILFEERKQLILSDIFYERVIISDESDFPERRGFYTVHIKNTNEYLLVDLLFDFTSESIKKWRSVDWYYFPVAFSLSKRD